MKIAKIYTSLIKQLRKRGETPEETLRRNTDVFPAVFFAGMEIAILSREAFEFIEQLEVPHLPDTTHLGPDKIIDISVIGIKGKFELTHEKEVKYLHTGKVIAISHKLALIEMPEIPGEQIAGSFITNKRMYMVTGLDAMFEEDTLSRFRFFFWFFENYENFNFEKKQIRSEQEDWGTLLPSHRKRKSDTDIVPLEWLVAGHFRLQPYGKGRQEHKLIFIGPQKRMRQIKE
ncbi:hypothetical protein BLM37_03260 [Candidatus Gracilibacteria bacterium GN02-873]|nr:hypothetical protein BLM37_03260 [Candidatus Gracilibacteria bacterium GN02-873]